jgi:hypothetical protein
MMPDNHSTTGPVLSTTGSFVSVLCPECDGTLARRSHREGLAEKMLSLMYVYPFRCQFCGHRFFAIQWGVRYHKVAVEHREYHRHQTQIPLMLFGREGEFHGMTADLSINGCTLTASGPFQENSKWGIRLLLPYDPNPVMVDEAVVRTVRNQQIGMEFVRSAPVEKERIGRFIEAAWKRTLPGANTRIHRPTPRPHVSGMATQSGQSPLLR